jgi:tetratricopeptide (TPR) repeat protein
VTGGGWVGDALEDRSALMQQRDTHPNAFAFKPPAVADSVPSEALPSGALAAMPAIVVTDPDGLPAQPTVADDVTALLTEAKTLAAAGRAQDALVEVQRAVIRAPKAPEVLFALGQAHARLGEHRPAAQAYGRLLEQRPNVVDAIYGQARAHVLLGELAAAKPLLTRLQALRPDDTRVQRLAARTSAGPDALEVSRRAAAKGALSAVREHADRLAQAGQVPEAANYYGQAAAKAPKDVQLHIKWGTALAAAGRLEQAKTALTAAVKLDPKSILGWQTLATVQARRGENRAAARSLEALIKAAPSANASGRLRARIERLRAQP